ncbi:MAG TPA: hypothetical protein DIW46_02415 [Microbacterium sp.]|uniref:hypothetical protein n=1 Tax=Microbacterium sp. TaxID=51671 RepID=UPI000EF00EA4|nr:hypothetical protein [Microbacterium sp.]
MVQIVDASADAAADAPVAFVLPGAGYPALAPLLYWPVGMLRAAGWRVYTASWDDADRSSPSAQHMLEHALDKFSAEVPALDLIVAKSLGTFALPRSVDAGIAGVWLTPLLNVPEIAAALKRADARHLVVGGTADRHWIPSELTETGAQVHEVPGADHSLRQPDWQDSLTIQAQVFTRVADHITSVRPA